MGIEVKLKYLKIYDDQHGVQRVYFRRKGQRDKPLPGVPGSKEFMAAYYAALGGGTRAEPSREKGEGTFGKLISEYENSAVFEQHKDSTKREWRYELRKLEAECGDMPVKALETKHICALIDRKKATPGAANTLLRKLKVLLKFAVQRGYRTDNPALSIEMLEGGEYRPWTADEMQAYEERWPVGTQERTAYALALYTGQRRSDVVKMTFKQIAGDEIRGIKQEKKRKKKREAPELTIAIHPELQAALAAVHPRSESAILASRKKGTVLNEVYFGQLMAAAIDKAGLPDECVLHGLRKCAAVALIDAGCTYAEAMAITGHKSVKVFEHYAKMRDQPKLSRSGMKKWGDANKTSLEQKAKVSN